MIDSAISLDFAEGIDRKALRHLRDRFLRLNQTRFRQALQAMGSRQQAVLELLPLILHGNCPTLPGYLDVACPHTIAGFEPTPGLIDLACRYSRSFRWRSQHRRTADIEAVFIMGSPGTIAHAADSDVDVWLCHRDDLSPAGHVLLARKTRAISDWAAGLGLELTIFLLSGEQLRSGRVEAQVDADNCGSAQHFLLLDEFYRSAIHLAGRYPLWWLVPADQESNYGAFADRLRERRFIKAEDYLDLGSVPRIPPGEFLGAGVWQLYKGVDAPWKAVLKLLLIESYAAEGGLRPLSLSLKRGVYEGHYAPEHLDPYYMLYRHLEAYLQGGRKGRLALVRQAFYLKTGAFLSRSDSMLPDWRQSQVTALVSEWGWSRDHLAWLDNRHLWRVEEVQRERRGIVGELTRSYRFLSRLARERRHDSDIRALDMALLGRKLYAAFQRKSGKVDMINPAIAPDLEEESLCFLHEGPGAAREGWRVCRELGLARDGRAQTAIKHSAGLLELLLWCYCNGLLSCATRLNIQAGCTRVSLVELRALILVLEDEVPVYPVPASKEALLARSRRLTETVFVNVGVDPLQYLTEQGMHKLSDRHDALGYSSARENLVVTLDTVGLNTWGEINVSRYDSGDTLIQYLQQYLAQLAAAQGARPRLSVHCYCAGRAGAIARRVEAVIDDVAAAFFPRGASRPEPLRYVLEVDQRFFILQFVEGQPRFIACPDRSTLLNKLGEPQTQPSRVVLDPQAMVDDPVWHAACGSVRPGGLQIVFEVVGHQARVWLSDEAGALLYWRCPFAGVRSLLEPEVRFLETVIQRRQFRQRLFLPGLQPAIECLELCFDGSDYQAVPRTLTIGRPGTGPSAIHGVGRVEQGSLAFDLYCDEREFSSREHGEALFRAVAAYALSRRTGATCAPLAISDLHLPDELDEQRDASSAQYVRLKLSLEQSLNQALSDVQSGAGGV